MQISQAFPSSYLKAGDLQGKEVTVIIDRVVVEDLGGEHKPILYFQGKERGLVLNKTNANTIAGIYGEETDNWSGQPVTLGTAWVDFQGKQVQGIRVRPQVAGQHTTPTPAQPAPQSENPAAELADEIPF